MGVANKALLGLVQLGTFILGCGPSVSAPAGVEGSDEAVSESSSTSAQGGVSSSTGEGPCCTTSESTGFEAPEPLVCDAGFDSALDPGTVVSTHRVALGDERGGLASIAVSSSVSVVAVGTTYVVDPDTMIPDRSGWLMHLSADGDRLGEFVLDLNDDVDFNDVALAQDGSAIVVGTERGLGDAFIVVYAVGQDGALRWRQELDFGPESEGVGGGRVAVSAQGRIVVATTKGSPGGDTAIALVELASTGEPLRALAVPADVPRFQRLNDLEFDRAGLLYAGTADVIPSYGGQTQEWIGRWDVEGTYLGAWERPTDGEFLLEMSVRDEGVTTLSWTLLGPERSGRPLLRRLDEAGNERWAVLVEPEAGDYYNHDSLLAEQLTTDCLGRSWVYARQPAGRGFAYDHWLIVYDDDGAEVERHQINDEEEPPGYAVGIADIAVDPFGNLISAGIELSPSSRALFVQTFAR